MSSVPISMDNLELIVSDCARDLLERWAIESDLQEHELADYAVMAAETATFVIDKFMGYMNGIMERESNPFK
jgi:hypothetical protein